MRTGGNATATREANGKEAANEEHFGRPSERCLWRLHREKNPPI
jgi:hypothetical protein